MLTIKTCLFYAFVIINRIVDCNSTQQNFQFPNENELGNILSVNEVFLPDNVQAEQIFGEKSVSDLFAHDYGGISITNIILFRYNNSIKFDKIHLIVYTQYTSALTVYSGYLNKNDVLGLSVYHLNCIKTPEHWESEVTPAKYRMFYGSTNDVPTEIYLDTDDANKIKYGQNIYKYSKATECEGHKKYVSDYDISNINVYGDDLIAYETDQSYSFMPLAYISTSSINWTTLKSEYVLYYNSGDPISTVLKFDNRLQYSIELFKNMEYQTLYDFHTNTIGTFKRNRHIKSSDLTPTMNTALMHDPEHPMVFINDIYTFNSKSTRVHYQQTTEFDLSFTYKMYFHLLNNLISGKTINLSNDEHKPSYNSLLSDSQLVDEHTKPTCDYLYIKVNTSCLCSVCLDNKSNSYKVMSVLYDNSNVIGKVTPSKCLEAVSKSNWADWMEIIISGSLVAVVLTLIPVIRKIKTKWYQVKHTVENALENDTRATDIPLKDLNSSTLPLVPTYEEINPSNHVLFNINKEDLFRFELPLDVHPLNREDIQFKYYIDKAQVMKWVVYSRLQALNNKESTFVNKWKQKAISTYNNADLIIGDVKVAMDGNHYNSSSTYIKPVDMFYYPEIHPSLLCEYPALYVDPFSNKKKLKSAAVVIANLLWDTNMQEFIVMCNENKLHSPISYLIYLFENNIIRENTRKSEVLSVLITTMFRGFDENGITSTAKPTTPSILVLSSICNKLTNFLMVDGNKNTGFITVLFTLVWNYLLEICMYNLYADHGRLLIHRLNNICAAENLKVRFDISHSTMLRKLEQEANSIQHMKKLFWTYLDPVRIDPKLLEEPTYTTMTAATLLDTANSSNMYPNINCLICKINPATVTLNPCGHKCICENCSLITLFCPQCSASIILPKENRV